MILEKLLRNKKGLRLDLLAYSLVIFGLCIFAANMMISDANTNYNVTIQDSEFKDVYNTIDDTYSISKNSESNLEGQNIIQGNALDSLISGAGSALKPFFGMFNIIGDIISALAVSFGVPRTIIQFFIVIMTIAVTFSLIYLFWRYKP